MKTLLFESALIKQWQPYRRCGILQRIVSNILEVQGLEAALGELCLVSSGKMHLLAEVIELHHDTVRLLPFSPIYALSIGAEVTPLRRQPSIAISSHLLGKVIDGFGHSLDLTDFSIPNRHLYNINSAPPSPTSRKLIQEIFPTGIKAIDAFVTIGKGQRLGIFSEPGCGKTSLLSAITHHSLTTVNIVVLIGERGREIRETIELLTPSLSARKTILVVAPAHETAAMKVLTGKSAMTIAEFFRNKGHDVLFVMDSLSRWIHALQEIALAKGEPISSHHYAASVFHEVAQFVERAGNNQLGSITAFFSMLNYANHPDIFIEYMRSLLDGHIFLSPISEALAYPAIDVVNSLSRVAQKITPPKIYQKADKIRYLLKKYYAALDIIQLGAYVSGQDTDLDRAIQMLPEYKKFLQQALSDGFQIEKTWEDLTNLISDCDK